MRSPPRPASRQSRRRPPRRRRPAVADRRPDSAAAHAPQAEQGAACRSQHAGGPGDEPVSARPAHLEETPISRDGDRSLRFLDVTGQDLDAALTLGDPIAPTVSIVDDAARPLSIDIELPERLGYRLKRAPARAAARHRSSSANSGSRNPVAFGVLAPDCISSSAYGTGGDPDRAAAVRRSGGVLARAADHGA